MTATRATIVHFLVALVLACPYLCLPRAVGRSGQSAVQGCLEADPCCPGADSEPCKHGPGKPGHHVCTGTCLCHGAILSRHVTPPAPDQSIASPLPPVAGRMPGEWSCGGGGSAAEPNASHFPTADSGRTLRALIQSFLL
ncbi:MAG: hypothetical protein ABSF26_05330 [Thermoguttaceae bacterium]